MPLSICFLFFPIFEVCENTIVKLFFCSFCKWKQKYILCTSKFTWNCNENFFIFFNLFKCYRVKVSGFNITQGQIPPQNYIVKYFFFSISHIHVQTDIHALLKCFCVYSICIYSTWKSGWNFYASSDLAPDTSQIAITCNDQILLKYEVAVEVFCVQMQWAVELM